VESALTGHLVFSTLHTNDAAGAITRLGKWASSPSSPPLPWSGSLPSAWCASSAPTAGGPWKPGQRNSWRLLRTSPLPRRGPRQDLPPCGLRTVRWHRYRGRTGVFELLVVSEPSAGLSSACFGERDQGNGDQRGNGHDAAERIPEGAGGDHIGGGGPACCSMNVPPHHQHPYSHCHSAAGEREVERPEAHLSGEPARNRRSHIPLPRRRKFSHFGCPISWRRGFRRGSRSAPVGTAPARSLTAGRAAPTATRTPRKGCCGFAGCWPGLKKMSRGV